MIKDKEKLIADGYLKEVKHPTEDLYLYNYTQLAQLSGLNDPIWQGDLLNCRGLILDGEGNTVAQPFSKFWNLEQYENNGLPAYKSFQVYEKYDGSLILASSYKGSRIIATRGSFESDQSYMARNILDTKYSYIQSFPENKTFLFELIHKKNRIVVDYGNTEDLVLLCVIDNKTGENLELENLGFPIVREYEKEIIERYKLNK